MSKATKPGPIPTERFPYEKENKPEKVQTTNGTVGKSGIKTSEFWIALLKVLIGPIISIFVVTGTFNPETTNMEELSDQILVAGQAVIACVATAMSGWTATKYINSRAVLKNTQMQVDGTIQQRK